MKKFVFAGFCTLALVGFVVADEFVATITKVDGNKVTFMKGKKDEAKEGTAEAAADVKVYKGVFDKDTKKTNKGDLLADGLKNDAFKADKGVKATITTDDKSGKITQIIVGGGGKGGKKGGN